MLKNEVSINKFLTTAGTVFILRGLATIYFFIIRDIKPEFLQLNVFTLYSKYLETKSFELIKNNQSDELAFTIYWTGWILIVYRFKKSLINRQ